LKRPLIGFLFLGQAHSEYPDVSLCLSKHGFDSHLIDLNDSNPIKWDEYSLINVRECCGYHLDPDFLHKVEVLENRLGNTPITNSLDIIRAAIDKGKYLKELEQEGVDTIPTLWLKRGATVTLEDIIRKTGWNDLVVKPTVSSKCWNTYRVVKRANGMDIMRAENQHPSALKGDVFEQHQAFSDLLKSHDVCLQKFMPEILSRGELSFVFIGGEFSHAVQKTVASNNWIAHEFFGGKNGYYKARVAEINWAQDIYARLEYKYGHFLYARIDGISDGQKLRLLECELVVPRLFLREGQAFDKYAIAIKKRLTG
jgi:glutathione synthase/RimK-type ligase-like ATP-grasp enzyme